jgi:replicative DNA helicase
MINKTKPHSPEAETAVIASCLLKEDGSVYDEVSQIVTPTDFYVQRNQILFASIASLVSTGRFLGRGCPPGAVTQAGG